MKWPVIAELPPTKQPWHENYYAMLSTQWQGIVTDPSLMSVPVDDHLVHRGDGVFETVKCLGGRIYHLEPHLERLRRSMEAIGLAPPLQHTQMVEALIATIQAGGHADCLVRILVSRGPGGFGIDPRECPAGQLYLIAYACPPPFMERHPEGAKAGICDVPPRDPFFSAIKTCNYLSNVRVKMAANQAGYDFAIGLDPDGHLTESATENICMLTADRMLVSMPHDHMLPGTTLQRVLELAEALVSEGTLAGIETRPVTPEEMAQAAEILICGTTTHVTAVTAFEGQPVGAGRPGPVHARLSALFEADFAQPGSNRLTVVPDLAKG